eukprot:g12118.t1
MKVVVGYDLPPSSVPFWRQKQLAGYAISERGPCQQIHDHCSGEGVSMRRHALFGWVDEDDPVKSLSKEERRLRVLEQLAQLFGEDAKEKVSFYQEQDWKADPYTHHPAEPEERDLEDGWRCGRLITLLSAALPICPEELERLRHHPRYGDAALAAPALNGKLFFGGTETARRHGGFLAGAIASGLEVASRVLATLPEQTKSVTL